MGEISTVKIKVTTTGGDGAATGSAQTEALNGFLLDVFLDYHASAPGSTDVTIAYTERGGNLVVVSNNATDGLYAPRQTEHDAAAASLGAGAYYPLNQPLTISVAQANALTACVTAHIRYLRG